jgi:hypothetical protein
MVARVLQFAFCFGLLSCIVLCPALWRLPRPSLVNNTVTHWLPTAWFTGMFEWLRGSSRWYVRPLAVRAIVSLLLATGGAVAASIAAIRRHLQISVAGSAAPAGGGGLRVVRAVARALTADDRVATATADFVLLTLARNGPAQLLVAMNLAVGAAIVLAVVSWVSDLASLLRPSTQDLWIPLVFAFWATVGLRAAFFMPAELPATWVFRASARATGSSCWSGTRASMLAVIVPPALALTGFVTVPVLGWSVALRHAVIVFAISVIVIEAAALAIDFVPFTRPYEPGRANLKTRWWLYPLGLWTCAYLPAYAELPSLSNAPLFLGMVAALTAVIVGLDRIGSARAGRRELPVSEDRGDPLAALRVLDLAGAAESARLSHT